MSMIKYTSEELSADLRAILEKELLPLVEAKGHDYSGTHDTFDNFREFGSRGILVRINDKVKRLKNILESGKQEVMDESIEDTLHDLINYSNYMLILRRQELTLKDNEAANTVVFLASRDTKF